ncbi:sphingosine-1-phosphate phosphatase 2 isoform X1 [Gouania willdenowi]|uniref:Phosphatidic acid phosphatase type 2/haloperoxidase domain-containing protein n=1 Tax=Gouania willdenowi TaxID=441366 RepID=A0A8C5HR82_GOUWI|nr:sphingosine-1-phosphate phosphatase 2 isoform X1 [Gouania willdenowi]
MAEPVLPLPSPVLPEPLAYLHDPELVARFQRRCGLFLIQPGGTGTGSGPQNSTGTGARGHLRAQCDQDNNNSNDKYRQNGHAVDESSRPQYEAKNWLLHVLFLLSAGLGHEVFYICCLPCIHWNLDPFLCRRLVNVWTLVMYVGQVLKDILKLPRPPSPPVVKLETRVDAEYGLPSTHAMAATAITFTLLLSAPSRVQIQVEVGLLMAVTLSSLVCLSRLYTGMHSVLDVLCGVVISGLLMLITYPYWDTFDHFQLTSPWSPVSAVTLLLLLSYTYPELDHYSTTRGDTTTILGVCAGCSVGYWANQQLGDVDAPLGVLPVPLPALTTQAVVRGVARYLVGVTALVGTRQVVKALSLRALYAWYDVPRSDDGARRRKRIEVPYKFVTYSAVGVVNSLLVNRLFILLGLR